MKEADDDRVFYNEWMKFMLNFTCGSFHNRLIIIFKIFDVEDSQILKPEYVRIILKLIPLWPEA